MALRSLGRVQGGGALQRPGLAEEGLGSELVLMGSVAVVMDHWVGDGWDVISEEDSERPS